MPYLRSTLSNISLPRGSRSNDDSRAAATADATYEASPMSLHIASFCAAFWFLNDIGMIPGASKRSRSPPIRIHRSDRVTPGLGALSATRRPSSRLINADLPTFGNPMTTARTGRGLRPRARRFSFMVSETWSACLITEGTPSPWFAFVHTTPWPRSLKNLTHESASSFETMSRRFKTMTRGLFPTHLGMDGCRVDIGMRPSRTSSTISWGAIERRRVRRKESDDR